jgi:hypothetical protein
MLETWVAERLVVMGYENYAIVNTIVLHLS